jgi:hypothetical protein
VTFCGRTFGAQEVELMRVIAQDYKGLGVTEIARRVCELLDWKRPNVGLKNHECRQLLERLEAEGRLRISAVRKMGGRGPRQVDLSQLRREQNQWSARPKNANDWSWRWRKAQRRAEGGGSTWSGITTWDAVCRSERTCVIGSRQRELACLLWTSPAWKMKPRDIWIGWSEEQPTRTLQSIVNNGRLLILPWVHIQGLASKILAHSARQLPQDWQRHYGHRPLLLETLADRFRGACYRAANWIYVGQTTGRDRMDREHKAHGQAIKDI